MPKYPYIKDALSFNKQKLCSVCNCYRHGLSAYCHKHNQRAITFGHPLGYGLKKKDYEGEVKLIAKLFEHNPNHLGLQEGILFFDNWHGPCPDRLFFLRSNGVTPEQLLIEVSAVWLFGSSEPNHLIKSDRHLICLLGQRVLNYKRGRNAPKITVESAYRHTGYYIYNNIGILLINIAKSIIKNQEERYRIKVKLAEPFIIK